MATNPFEVAFPALTSPLPLRPAHSRLVHSEVVRDLMPDRLSHHLFELCSRAR